MTINLERRAFVRSGALLATGVALVDAVAPRLAAAQVPAAAPSGAKPMTYAIKPMSFDPKKIKGLSEKILISHYENNYSGAVKRLDAISEQLAGLDFAKAPGFLINGLKREELIAANSMILHELYFAGLGEESRPGPALTEAIARDFGSMDRWRAEFVAMGKAEGGGSGWVLLPGVPTTGDWSTPGPPTTRPHSPAGSRSSRSICTSTPITWITAPRPAITSTPSCRRSAGRILTN
jgi:Fe-Mn family superoxide dismutase